MILAVAVIGLSDLSSPVRSELVHLVQLGLARKLLVYSKNLIC